MFISSVSVDQKFLSIQSRLNISKYQIITSYTLNFQNVLCQLYLNKSEGKKGKKR